MSVGLGYVSRARRGRDADVVYNRHAAESESRRRLTRPRQTVMGIESAFLGRSLFFVSTQAGAGARLGSLGLAWAMVFNAFGVVGTA